MHLKNSCVLKNHCLLQSTPGYSVVGDASGYLLVTPVCVHLSTVCCSAHLLPSLFHPFSLHQCTPGTPKNVTEGLGDN